MTNFWDSWLTYAYEHAASDILLLAQLRWNPGKGQKLRSHATVMRLVRERAGHGTVQHVYTLF